MTETKAQFQRRAILAARKVMCGTIGQPDHRPEATMCWYAGLWVPSPAGLVLAHPDNPAHVKIAKDWARGRGEGLNDPWGLDAIAIRKIPQRWTNPIDHPDPAQRGFGVAQSMVGRDMLPYGRYWMARLTPWNGRNMAEGYIRIEDEASAKYGDIDTRYYGFWEQINMPDDAVRWQNLRPTKPIKCPRGMTCWQMVFAAHMLPIGGNQTLSWCELWASWGFNILAVSIEELEQVAQIAQRHGVLWGLLYNFSDWNREMSEEDKTRYLNQIVSWTQTAVNQPYPAVRLQIRDSPHNEPPMFPTAEYNAEIASMA